MTKFPKTCGADVSLGDAASLMLENDCGCLSVKAAGGFWRLVGTIVDRDISMAAQRQGKALQELLVGDAMEPLVWTCNPGDPIGEAEEIIREVGVRRPPVVDGSERLLGVTDRVRMRRRGREGLRSRGLP